MSVVSGCIQHLDIRYIQVRCDYLELYKGNEHKAKIVRILESWTDSKREQWYKAALDKQEQKEAPPEPDFWITMSHQQFRQFMYETASVDTIKSNIAELINKDKHVERRTNPDNPYGPPQYRLIFRAIQKGLNKLGTPPLSIPPLEEDTPPGKPTPPPGVETTPTQGGETPSPSLENAPLGEGGKTATSKNSTTKIPQNTSKNKEESTSDSTSPTLDASASLPPPSLQEKNVVDTSQKETDGQPVTVPGLPDSNPAAGGTTEQSSYSQREEQAAIGDKVSSKKVTQAKPIPLKPKKEEIILTAEQQSIFDEWCKMPWFKGVAPALETNDAQHLQKLSVYNPTMESMLKVMNWARSKEVDRNGWYKGKKWTLYWLAKEYPGWASLQFTEEPIQLSEARSALDERSARNLEKLKARVAAKHAAQSPPPAQSATA